MILNIRHTHRADRSHLKDKLLVKKSFDTPISEFGRSQAYNIGLKIGEYFGREKPYMVIVSPHLRCMETAELIICGLDYKSIKLYENKFFVEDALREQQTVGNVGSLENFYKLDFFES